MISQIDDEKLSAFLVAVYKKYGHDFIHYNYTTLKRRIEVHTITLKINSFDKYCDLVLKDIKYFEEMFSHFSINVTEFFREPDQLYLFRKHVVPYLKTFSHIKVWCAGCSSGESPYSLAIILQEEGLLDRSQIYATDFNNRVLALAKKGLFEINNKMMCEENYELSGGKRSFDEYFLKQGKYYQIKKNIKNHLLFFNHNLVKDGVMNEFQLIICKNVLIYFDENLKQKVIKLFDDSLCRNGFLILGKSEYLPDVFKQKFKHYLSNSKVYQKLCR